MNFNYFNISIVMYVSFVNLFEIKGKVYLSKRTHAFTSFISIGMHVIYSLILMTHPLCSPHFLHIGIPLVLWL